MKTDEHISGLKAIDTSSLVDKVEMNLIDYFSKKKLQPGDSIPKELELAEIMGVSRTVIRETLTRLKTMGLIESKKHIGTIIKSPDLSSIMQKSMIPGILDEGTLKDIFELRLTIEVGMSDLVVTRVTDKDIEELFSIVKNEISPSENTLFDVDYEILFHSKLYEITGNQTLKSFQKMLLPVFSYVYTSGLINKEIADKKYVSHKELVEVLRLKDADMFRTAMRKHLENHFKRLLSMDEEK
ncbi:transcriptional regulator, GntR family [Aquipluma nitroreducens]|uniref:Transcriptional regulator, GntR family n=1 Tax=Aquipluma nitroreducens TaxID=2010828 RepID=A0A5K7SFC3_9BACT|nr:FCD domain-containing protein [Aquipluma nitroreducens]BBE20169.1 transcriptional regulator, GntR family [Aquipluma nitroreducens]